MSYPNLPKSLYSQAFPAFRSCKAAAFLCPLHQKSNKNLSLYRLKIFYRTDFWSIKAKTERILYGFASILTMSERKSVYKKHGSDNSLHPKIQKLKGRSQLRLRPFLILKFNYFALLSSSSFVIVSRVFLSRL